MKNTCYYCQKLIKSQHALILSPPIKSNKDASVSTVHEYYLCTECWTLINNFMEKDSKE